MRVLWFSNNSAGGHRELFKSSISKLKGTGGWLASLNSCLEDSLDLHVGFHFNDDREMFVCGKTKYYPIPTPKSFFGYLINKSVNLELYTDKYLSLIERIKPDIIHIHGTENYFISILSKTGIPIVVSIQGNLTVINYKFYSGFHGKYVRDFVLRGLKDLLFGPKCFHFDKKRISKMSFFENSEMSNIKYLIGRTQWDYRITRVLAPESKYFLGNELLRDSFYSKHWNNIYKNGKLVLFTTNSDNYYKGIETVFYAVHLLNLLGIDFEWRIAGIDNKSLIYTISRKYLGDCFPHKNFTLLGSLDEEQLSEELLKSHIYIAPSHIENSPNSLCEAMLMGLPCISTFAGGVGSLINDYESGLLIQDGDPWNMAGAIIELKNNPHLMLKFSQNAKIKAEIRHSKETVKTQYLNIYSEILYNNYQ